MSESAAMPRGDQAAGVSPSWDPLSVASVTEVVYGQLRGRILGGIAPGQPLKLIGIASELGVSTTPVRVAIERLVADGLVVHQGRKGSTVAPLSLTDFRDIYAVRRGLEGNAARTGAAKLSDVELGHMEERMARLNKIASPNKAQVDEYLECEWQIHLICYGAAGHRRLLKEIQAYRRQAERYFRLALSEGINVVDDLSHQRDFCQACTDRDSARAESMAHVLIDWTVDRVSPLLEHLGQ